MDKVTSRKIIEIDLIHGESDILEIKLHNNDIIFLFSEKGVSFAIEEDLKKYKGRKFEYIAELNLMKYSQNKYSQMIRLRIGRENVNLHVSGIFVDSKMFTYFETGKGSINLPLISPSIKESLKFEKF